MFAGLDNLLTLNQQLEKTAVKMTLQSEPILHDKFRQELLVHYNFALLRLPRPVDFSRYGKIRPVCLPASSRADYAGRDAVTGGFGHTKVDRYEGKSLRKGQGRNFANHLQTLTVEIMDSDSCEESWAPLLGRFEASPDKLCAIKETGDLCDGDKGGGLVVNTPSGPELVGVASFTVGCLSTFRNARLPIVYGKVAAILDWIERQTSDASSCRIPTPTTRSETCKVCGTNYAENEVRVIGGRDADRREYPWAALALINNKFRKGD